MTITAIVATAMTAHVTTHITTIGAMQTGGSTRVARLDVVLGVEDEPAAACDTYIYTNSPADVPKAC